MMVPGMNSRTLLVTSSSLSRILLSKSNKKLLRHGTKLFTDWKGARGYDLTFESLSHGGDARFGPKIALHAYAPTGFVVSNLVKKVDLNETSSDGILHMNGSILAFPYGCFLWNVEKPEQVTVASLSPILLHRQPPIEYLFIGSNQEIPQLNAIKAEFRKKKIVVERLNLINAIGTFNILNAEDRQVAVALLLDPSEEDEDD